MKSSPPYLRLVSVLACLFSLNGVLVVQHAKDFSGVRLFNSTPNNTSARDMYLQHPELRIKKPEDITNGSFKYHYTTVSFIPTESGYLYYGMLDAHGSNALLLYKDHFNPAQAEKNILDVNVFTVDAIHAFDIGTQHPLNCGFPDSCPQVRGWIEKGVLYTLVATHQSAEEIEYFSIPKTFYGTNTPLFFSNTTLDPMYKREKPYVLSDIGKNVHPIFTGGTLQITEDHQVISSAFLLSNLTDNTLDLQQHSVKFSGSFHNYFESLPGYIRIKNGTLDAQSDAWMTGGYILGKNSILQIAQPSNIGIHSQGVYFDGGTLTPLRSMEISQAFLTTNPKQAINGNLHVPAHQTFSNPGIQATRGVFIKSGSGTWKIQSDFPFNGTLQIEEGAVIMAHAHQKNLYIRSSTQGALEFIEPNNHMRTLNTNGFVGLHSQNQQQTYLNLRSRLLLGSNSQLSIQVTSPDHPIITTQDATLNGSLNISLGNQLLVASDKTWKSSREIAAAPQSHTIPILKSQYEPKGDWSQILLNGLPLAFYDRITHQDYVRSRWSLEKNTLLNGLGGATYALSEKSYLRWTAPDAKYYGQFTIADQQTFTLNHSVLQDHIAPSSQWDGKSLIKKGQGTLAILSPQSYTGNTVVEEGTLVWGQKDTIQTTEHILQQNVYIYPEAYAAITHPNTTLRINGNLMFMGDDHNNSNLLVKAGYQEHAKIIVEGTADIHQALLQLGDFHTEAKERYQRASDLIGPSMEYVLIHARQGFANSEVWGGDNKKASFKNSANIVGVDYLYGLSSIVNCIDASGNQRCFFSEPEDNDKTQEYIISNLGLAWNYGGSHGTHNHHTRIKNGSFSIDAHQQFNVDVPLADQDQGTDLAPDQSGRLGFNSDYGWWDGKTLTKKGKGTLILSENNLFSGDLHIEEGTIHIHTADNLGSGNADKTIHMGEAQQFATLSISPPETSSITLEQSFSLDPLSKNTFEINGKETEVTITGGIKEHGLNQPSSQLIKSGAGSLVIAPKPTNELRIGSNIIVQEGALSIRGNPSNMVGNWSNASQLLFEIDAPSIIQGGITNVSSPLSTSPTDAKTYKKGDGALTIKGSSATDWYVESGSLILEGRSNSGHMHIFPHTQVTWQPTASNNTPLEFKGKITAASSSSILFNLHDQTLPLHLEPETYLGNLRIASGHVQLINSKETNIPHSIILNSAYINGKLSILGNHSYLHVLHTLVLSPGSELFATLDPRYPREGRIYAQAVEMDASVQVHLLGFDALLNHYKAPVTSRSRRSTSRLMAPVHSVPIKMSDLQQMELVILGSATPIKGLPTDHKTVPFSADKSNYLVYKHFLQENPQSAYPYEYHIGHIDLAWNQGGSAYGTGDFSLLPDTIIDVDIALNNQNDPVFASGWDGKSLTKKGEGTLILSAANSFTGSTKIENGTVVLASKNTLSNSTEVVLENDAQIIVEGESQILRSVASSSTHTTISIQPEGRLSLIQPKAENASEINTYAGTITTNAPDHSAVLALEEGDLRLTGNTRVSSIELAPTTQLQIVGAEAAVHSRSIQLHDAELEVSNQAMLVAQLTGDANSRLTIKDQARWLVESTSSVPSVFLDNGTITTQPLMVKVARDATNNTYRSALTIHTDAWNAKDGNLTLGIPLSANGGAEVDSLIIHQQGTGNTKVRIFDLGGFEKLQQARTKIVPIQSANGVGVIEPTAFSGELVSGALSYPLQYDSETGSFFINTFTSTIRKDFELQNTLLERLTQGQFNTSVQALGRFHAPFENVYNDTKVFTEIQHGLTNQRTAGNQLNSQDTRIRLSGSTPICPQNDQCLRIGWIGGMLREQGALRMSTQTNPTEDMAFTSKRTYLGGFFRAGDPVFAEAALIGAYEKIDRQQNTLFRGHTVASSLELGFTHLQAAHQLQASAQILYQFTRINDHQSPLETLHFSAYHAGIGKIGLIYAYNDENHTEFSIQTAIWHQFAGHHSMNSYTPNGQFLNQIQTSDKHNTWADLGFHIREQLNSHVTTALSLGYQGTLDKIHTINGSISLEIHW